MTGLSGAGKSVAIKVLEDLGYYTLDNLPPDHLVGPTRAAFDERLTETEDHTQLVGQRRGRARRHACVVVAIVAAHL